MIGLAMCVFAPQLVCPGGREVGAGVCQAFKETEPDFWKNCQWFLDAHPKKKRELTQFLNEMTEEELEVYEKEQVERIRKNWQKIMKKIR